MSLTDSAHETSMAGIILCGGHSRRMGQDKAQLRLGDRSFLEHLESQLKPVCHPVVLVGRADQQNTFADHCEFVVDVVPDAGPLAGLVTGLETVRSRADLALVVACDTPLIQPALVALLVQAMSDSDAAIPWDGVRLYGLTAIYRTEIAAMLRQMLELGHRRIQDIDQFIRVKKISLDDIRQADPQMDSLLGCNAPEEYERLTARYDELFPGAQAS